MNRKLLKKVLPLVVGIGLMVVLVLQLQRPSQASPVGPPPPQEVSSPGIRVEGRVVTYPGAKVTVGTELTGRLVELRVDEKSVVKKGEVIALLNDAEERSALAEAQALVAEARAQFRQMEADLGRQRKLWEAKVVSLQSVENTQRDHDVARARLAVAQSKVRQLESALAKSRIVAPIDGVVISRMADPGEFLTEGTPVVEIADLRKFRIEAEVDEYDTGKVALGAPVRISAEGFPDASWAGKVEDIPNTVMGRQLKPQDPSRPIDTRVLLVKVALTESTPLKLDQRVEVTILPAANPDA
jgi:multidrug efflux pump subunit AcrA (membrane-fusion protein)